MGFIETLAKFKIIFILTGIICLVLGLLGIFLIHQCEVSPEEMVEETEEALAEPFTIAALQAIGDIFSFIAETFIAILCPVLNFIDSFASPVSNFLILFVAGIALILFGWFVLP
jgi:hypothetical protein